MKYKHSYSNQILLPNSSTIILYSQIILYGQKNYSYLNQNILLISVNYYLANNYQKIRLIY